MSTLEKAIKENKPDLSHGSLKTYTSLLRNIYKNITGDDITDPSASWFNNHPKEIMEYFTKPMNGRKTKLATLLSVINDKNMRLVYHDMMMMDIKEYDEKMMTGEKSDKEKANWMSIEEVNQVFQDLKKQTAPLFRKKAINDDDRKRMQKYIVLALFVLQSPRRLKDYTHMLLHKTDSNENYITDKKEFVFNTYKSAGTHGTQVIPIHPELWKLIVSWRKFNPDSVWLIESYKTTNRGKQLATSQLNRLLNEIFGKNVSCNMLRHIYITDKVYKDVPALKKLEEEAEKMGHTVKTAMKIYKKNSE
jgi:hypothetical protein